MMMISDHEDQIQNKRSFICLEISMDQIVNNKCAWIAQMTRTMIKLPANKNMKLCELVRFCKQKNTQNL